MNWRNAIKDFMATQGWSKMRLAGELGIHFNTVHGWLRRKKAFTPLPVFQAMLRALFEKHGFDLAPYEGKR